MILLDLIYLAIYSLFRKVFTENSNNSPEVLSMGVFALLTGFSLDIVYIKLFYLVPGFSKRNGVFILFAGVVLVCAYVFFYHLKGNKINKKYNKYKSYLFIPGLLVFLWVFLL